MKHNDLVNLLSALKDNDGATLKNGECVTYSNGKKHNQQSILKWEDMSLIWLNEQK